MKVRILGTANWQPVITQAGDAQSNDESFIQLKSDSQLKASDIQ
jgi:hypothetical protein